MKLNKMQNKFESGLLQLSNKTFEFKGAVAKMAQKYCNDTRNNITLLTEAG
jgi:fatty acid-binding protein DegV